MTRERDCSESCLSTIMGTIETAARTMICAQITNPNSIGLPSMFRRGYGLHRDPVVPVARIGQFLDFGREAPIPDARAIRFQHFVRRPIKAGFNIKVGLQMENALDAGTDIAARVAANPTATPGNIEFVDSGTGVIVEGSYDRVAVQIVKSGIASRANSFVVLRDLNDPNDVSSHCRYVRSQQLLKENSGQLTPDLMKQFTQDHENGPGPNSLCRHGQHYEEETSQSSLVVEIDGENPKQTRFWIALGKPCHAWRDPDGFIEGTLDQPSSL